MSVDLPLPLGLAYGALMAMGYMSIGLLLVAVELFFMICILMFLPRELVGREIPPSPGRGGL